MAIVTHQAPAWGSRPAPPVRPPRSQDGPGGQHSPQSQHSAQRGIVLKGVLSAALALGLLAIGLPRLAGAPWAEVGSAMSRVSPPQLLALGALWVLGLSVHTISLSAALPGLTHRRSLLLNLTGSFVSNLVPLGGAAGTVANYSMVRSWGFGRVEFARWALVTNLWDNAVKLALPTLAIGWLARTAVHDDGLAAVAAWSAAVLVALAAGAACLFASDRVAARAGAVVAGGARIFGRSGADLPARAVALRRDTSGLVASTWGRLTMGKIAYAVLQAALCWASLRVVGVFVDPAVVFAAFAVERMLSLAVLTPGATGFVEVGMTGTLVALGVPAGPAAAGVLLYRGYTFLMEIPVGGAGMLWWWLRSKRPAPDAQGGVPRYGDPCKEALPPR